MADINRFQSNLLEKYGTTVKSITLSRRLFLMLFEELLYYHNLGENIPPSYSDQITCYLPTGPLIIRSEKEKDDTV